MSTQFLSKLSQNYIELLEDNEYYDITIEVAHIKLPNISPEVFQIILKYIYGDYALLYGIVGGPYFGDIAISSSYDDMNYNFISYGKNYYEKRIKDSDGTFAMEDYEVFQIIR
ncbi:BTB/POZ protein [Rhizophagus irregularis DAOM 181602=DAOM 197198]|nr:BTB/POZ protein [Rhizophagus irregularis DAOM 181602=DAOM 197198]